MVMWCIPRPKWSVQAIQFQCSCSVGCTYTAGTLPLAASVCAVYKMLSKRPFHSFMTKSLQCICSVYTLQAQCNYSVHAVQAHCTLQSAVCQQCMSSLYCRYTPLRSGLMILVYVYLPSDLSNQMNRLNKLVVSSSKIYQSCQRHS